MATSSIFHNIVIDTEESAERFIDALEKAEENAEASDLVLKQKEIYRKRIKNKHKEIQGINKLKKLNVYGLVYDKGHYTIRIYRGEKSQYFKRVSNKRIRRSKVELPKKGNKAHLLFDFWYTLY